MGPEGFYIWEQGWGSGTPSLEIATWEAVALVGPPFPQSGFLQPQQREDDLGHRRGWSPRSAADGVEWGALDRADCRGSLPCSPCCSGPFFCPVTPSLLSRPLSMGPSPVLYDLNSPPTGDRDVESQAGDKGLAPRGGPGLTRVGHQQPGGTGLDPSLGCLA